MKPGRFSFSVPRPYSTHAPSDRPRELEDAGVHLEERLRVVRQVGLHAVDDAEVVGVLGDFGEQVARSTARSGRAGLNFQGEPSSLAAGGPARCRYGLPSSAVSFGL